LRPDELFFFFFTIDAPCFHIAFLGAKAARAQHRRRAGLDDALEGHRPIDFVKLDTNGTELGIIAGAHRTIADVFGVASTSSKRVAVEYDRLTDRLGNEFRLLLEKDVAEIAKESTDPRIAEAILSVRQGNVRLISGYDGIFGSVRATKK